MAEKDALSKAKFGGGLFLTDFPVKIRVLTTDPIVSVDNYANTRYAFVVYNLDENKVQILNKGPGFAQRFQDIHADPDFGGDIRKIDVKVTTNGASGKEIRYTVQALGEPKELTQEQKKIIVEAKVDLEKAIKNGIRLSEVNEGKKVPDNAEDEAPEPSAGAGKDTAIEDLGGEPINLDDIPF